MSPQAYSVESKMRNDRKAKKARNNFRLFSSQYFARVCRLHIHCVCTDTSIFSTVFVPVVVGQATWK